MRRAWGRLTTRERPGSRADPAGDAPSSVSVADGIGLRVLHEGTNAVVDIVFLHGLTGTRISTWTHARSGVCWPKDFLAADIPNARILTFGYDADVVGLWDPAGMNGVSNHARDLLGALSHRRNQDDTADRKIIFVCHSLGGLVVEEAINLSRVDAEAHIRQIAECTLAIAFIGTPHHGSDLASWAKLATRLAGVVRRANADIVDVLQPGSQMLARIQNQFHNSQRIAPVAITCFYEDLPYQTIGVVVPHQSAILPGYANYSIHANHQEMTRFATREDSGYTKIFGELKRWIDSLPANASTPVSHADSAEENVLGVHPLLAAAASGTPELVELLLRTTSDVNVTEPGPTKRNALHFAAAFDKSLNMVPLLRAGVDVHAMTDQGHTPLFVAIILGNHEGVRVLLEQGHVDPNGRNVHGITPLMAAAVNARVEAARILLEHGADPFATQEDGWTALSIAFSKSCAELVEVLTVAMRERTNG
ncbi:ankyrin repeat-containing domain protein [Aspergillus pseudodeflectus]|uniref:Ankyrin repeat-containing domain protein n=1 Tax=Aspergillus pseudodeflectus TaxID=176178 RepID=A0ABR4KJ75_9EURO